MGGKIVGADGSDSTVGLEDDIDFGCEVSVVDKVFEWDECFEFG